MPILTKASQSFLISRYLTCSSEFRGCQLNFSRYPAATDPTLGSQYPKASTRGSIALGSPILPKASTAYCPVSEFLLFKTLMSGSTALGSPILPRASAAMATYIHPSLSNTLIRESTALLSPISPSALATYSVTPHFCFSKVLIRGITAGFPILTRASTAIFTFVSRFV